MESFEYPIDEFSQPEREGAVGPMLFREFNIRETERSIPERFEQMAAKYPDRIALKSKLYSFTYSELNAFANRIARVTLTRCSGREDVVALLLADDAPKIGAIFGSLMAGKIYVPMDPAFPRSALASTLEDCQPSAIISDNANLSLTRDLFQHNGQIINIDDLPENIDGENVRAVISPDHVAYILYTSGSTGKPKGIFQNHRNVLHKVRNYTNSSHITVDDRFSLVVPMTFSAAVPNIFAALLNGASLFPFNVKQESLANLANWIINQRITIYQSAATLFRYLTDGLLDKESFRICAQSIYSASLFCRPMLNVVGNIFPLLAFYAIAWLLRKQVMFANSRSTTIRPYRKGLSQ